MQRKSIKSSQHPPLRQPTQLTLLPHQQQITSITYDQLNMQLIRSQKSEEINPKTTSYDRNEKKRTEHCHRWKYKIRKRRR